MTIKTTLIWMCLLCASTFAGAQSPFDGTWRQDVSNTKLSERPLKLLLQNGRYQCLSCVHYKIDIPADGHEHPVQPDSTESEYSNQGSARVVDANTVVLRAIRDGKIRQQFTYAISPDGQRMTLKWVNYIQSSSDPYTEETEFVRVRPGPPSSHALSGEWRRSKMISASANETTMTIQSSANGMKLTDPVGEGWEAKFDGKEYSEFNDPGHTMASLKRISDNTLELTETRAGKVVNVTIMQVSPDGRTLQLQSHDPSRSGSEESQVWHKQ